jgi:hypothetical protein
LTTDISSKGIISEVWLDGDRRDLMLVCRTDNNLLKSYEEPFIIYDYQLSDI